MVATREPAAEPTDEPRRPMPWTRLVLIALAVAPPLTNLAVLLVKGTHEWAFLFTDDAYYYFGVARNIGAGNGSTFAGLVTTNGYHPLWMGALSALGLFLRTPYSLLGGVAVLQAVLWCGCVREATLLGRRLGSELYAIAGVVALGALAIVTGQLSFSGMESAPLLFLLVLFVRLLVEAEPSDRRSQTRLAVVIALVCLTRLDATATAIALAVVAASAGRPGRVRLAARWARLMSPAAAALVLYVIANKVIFDTATPVSGRAKSLGAPFWNTRPIEQFFEAGQYGQRPLWIGAITLTALAVAFVLGDWRSTLVGRRIMGCVAAFAAGQVALLAYLVIGTSYQVWAWYHYNLALMSLCAGILLAQSAAMRLGSLAPSLVKLAGLIFVAGQLPATFATGVNHHERAILVSDFIREELPENSVLAMGDRAGLVGYLADRPLLQTEGLMADAAWLRDLENGTALKRMVDEGVDYVVWSGIIQGRQTDRDGVPCIVLREPRVGDGPKFDLQVCMDDIVFHVGEGHDQFTVFRFSPISTP